MPLNGRLGLGRAGGNIPPDTWPRPYAVGYGSPDFKYMQKSDPVPDMQSGQMMAPNHMSSGHEVRDIRSGSTGVEWDT